MEWLIDSESGDVGRGERASEDGWVQRIGV